MCGKGTGKRKERNVDQRAGKLDSIKAAGVSPQMHILLRRDSLKMHALAELVSACIDSLNQAGRARHVAELI